ncbi:PH domain-containing protein [Actinomadura sp. WMMB 499]|uniref:PH domain-containing protein n=1 Tax=Actinomadura sp. WMMB 499 TaxID=1219491 RepID=UPI001243D47E|nr:PH domain-containing protein [Actinomadura sp. WMMB 499]QFG22527.1 PH domain-containing protein [Actinomadura sp. WMMB 499]
MNPNHGGQPYDPAAQPPPSPAPGRSAPVDGPGPPPGAVAAPPQYRPDEAFAPGGGLKWWAISRRHTWQRTLRAVLWAVPVGALGVFLLGRDGGLAPAAMWVSAVFLAAVVVGIVAELDRRSFGYAERADDLIVTHGVFVKRLIVVPYGRMQFVDVTAGLLERWMGIATVRMHTAAAATDATVPGLPAADAALLRDRLAHKGEERSMGL